MIEPLSRDPLLAGLYADPDRGYRIGPKLFRPGHVSVTRFVEAGPELDVDARRVLSRIVGLTLDLGGGADGQWIGVCMTRLGSDEVTGVLRLVELGLLESESNVPDPNGHELRTVVFPSRTLVAAVANGLPGTV